MGRLYMRVADGSTSRIICEVYVYSSEKRVADGAVWLLYTYTSRIIHELHRCSIEVFSLTGKHCDAICKQ